MRARWPSFEQAGPLRGRRAHAWVLAALLALYGALFLWFVPSVGPIFGSVLIVPAALAGWWFGPRVGALVAVIAIGMSLGLHALLGRDVWEAFLRGAFGTATLIGIGAAAGGFAVAYRGQRDQRLAVAEAESRARHLAEAAFDGIAIHEGGVIREVNSSFARLFGYQPSELIGMNAHQLLDGASHPALDDHLRTHKDDAYGVIGRTKQGGRILLEVQARDCTFDGRPARVTAVRDVTHRIAAEGALRESEERFRTLFENVALGLYRTTPDGRVLLANPALVRMLGYASVTELMQRDLNADDGAAMTAYSRSEWIKRLEKEGQVRGMDTVWRRKDGTPIHVRESARAIFGLDGRIVHFEGTVEDITAQKLAEAELAETQARQSGILAASLDAIIGFDEAGTIVEWNPAAEQAFGLSRESAIGSSALGLLGAAARSTEPRQEVLAKRPDGSTFLAELTVVETRRRGAPTYTAFVRDLTDVKRMEKEREAHADAIARSERLSALGTLVAGVAHEINNPLTYITGNIELALMDVQEAAARLDGASDAPDLGATARGLQNALGGAERIAHITRALKAVARQRSPDDREVVDLNTVLADAGALLQVGIPDAIQLEICPAPEPVRVDANVAELHQVILNLARNAIEALEGRPVGHVRLSAAQAGDIVTVRVQDDGPGIPPEAAAKLFTPFFTTKPHGTGLGLSIVHGIVRDHKGDVTVALEPRAGATVSIHLPAHIRPKEDPATAPATTPVAGVKPTAGIKPTAPRS